MVMFTPQSDGSILCIWSDVYKRQGFSRELGKLCFKVREARASTGKLNGYHVEARSGTEYKASEIEKDYTLAHIEKT